MSRNINARLRLANRLAKKFGFELVRKNYDPKAPMKSHLYRKGNQEVLICLGSMGCGDTVESGATDYLRHFHYSIWNHSRGRYAGKKHFVKAFKSTKKGYKLYR